MRTIILLLLAACTESSGLPLLDMVPSGVVVRHAPCVEASSGIKPKENEKAMQQRELASTSSRTLATRATACCREKAHSTNVSIGDVAMRQQEPACASSRTLATRASACCWEKAYSTSVSIGDVAIVNTDAVNKDANMAEVSHNKDANLNKLSLNKDVNLTRLSHNTAATLRLSHNTAANLDCVHLDDLFFNSSFNTPPGDHTICWTSTHTLSVCNRLTCRLHHS
jgi:hypothetical protein